jgi:N-acetylmuramoyl-L-alanine amidase
MPAALSDPIDQMTRAAPGRRIRPPLPQASLSLVVLAGLAAGLAAPLSGQTLRTVGVTFSEGEGTTFRAEAHRGYPAIPVSALGILGWRSELDRDRLRLAHRSGLTLSFRLGSPYFRWDDDLLQLAHAPYQVGEAVYVPLQLVVDLFPNLLPRAYGYDPSADALRVEGEPDRRALAGGASAPTRMTEARAAEAPAPPASPPGRARAPRIVVIDPGHGGGDPGAVGPGGVREKDVALAVGLALARELSRNPEIEVRMTRDRDVEVPLWLRGEWATEWKGERPGVFVSIHANALPTRPGVRGFETYFLSEARTEHERRVAAAENAPLERARGSGGDQGSDPLLASILRDLRTFDHQHWSALLAEMVQRELGSFHPGPDRGVKQGPFAVITNALMPSVLVEVGFLTNQQEERLLTQPQFHQDSARAIARAVEQFFQRYPPGGRE